MGILGNSECAACQIGKAMGVGCGGFCPYLEEEREAGSFVFEAGARAQSSWFLKSGTVQIVGDGKEIQLVQAPRAELERGSIDSGRYAVSVVATSKVQLCRRPIDWVPALDEGSDDEKGDPP